MKVFISLSLKKVNREKLFSLENIFLENLLVFVVRADSYLFKASKI